MTAPYIIGRADGSPVLVGDWPAIAQPDGTIDVGPEGFAVDAWREQWRDMITLHGVMIHHATAACVWRRRPARAPLYLGGADLGGAYLDGINFVGANLAGADLGNAHMAGACLVDANLEDADMVGAYLTGATIDDGEGGTVVLG